VFLDNNTIHIHIYIIVAMYALTKSPEYLKRYRAKEMAATIGVCENME